MRVQEKKTKGFTILELIVVIAIISIISAGGTSRGIGMHLETILLDRSTSHRQDPANIARNAHPPVFVSDTYEYRFYHPRSRLRRVSILEHPKEINRRSR